MRKMKDSGIPWLGEIPTEWDRAPLLNLLRSRISDGPHETPNLLDDGVPFISVDSLNESEDIDFSVVKKFISEADYQRYNQKANLKKGDILFSKAATIGKTAIVKDEKFMTWSPLAIIKIDEKICSNKYVYYVLNCKNLIIYVSMLGSHNTQINVGMRELEKAIVPFPSLVEQRAISDFLDRKCSEIDTLTTDIEKQIETLEAYKRSVITEAVTKGLSPDAEMKDSGVFYLGSIKATWNISKIGHVCSKLSRDFEATDVALICSNKGKVLVRGDDAVGLMMSDDNAMQGIQKGDIAIHGMDTWHGAIALSDYDGKITRVVHVCDSTEDKRFVVYYLQSLAYRSVYKLISNGVRGNTSDFRSWEKVKAIYVPIPSIEEQNTISDFLDHKCSAIDSIIADKKTQLETIADYKKSLIYEYVTGKKEVPCA